MSDTPDDEVQAAFPDRYRDGMTLRDYFAAEAISFIQWNKDHTELCAKKCYEIADAMMKAREA
jgi:hypothetical protein